MSRSKAPDGSARGVAISARLGYLAGRMVATASATYARLGLGSLEAKALLLLGDDGPATGSQISKSLGVDPAAISRTLRTLLETGAVSRSSEGSMRLSLTPRGEGLCEQIRIVAEERNRRLLGDLTAGEQALLLGYLERLWENMPELAELAASEQFFAD
ncbi:MAG: MarR family transcriptional regulator, partial [Caulobacteraceae bacterium]|nr:MarR family transcriptional regulator [Caulobacteraceae bacterium]